MAHDHSPRIHANSSHVRQQVTNLFPRELQRMFNELRERSANSARICASPCEPARSLPRTGERFAKNVFVSGNFQIFGERSFAANDRSPPTIVQSKSSPRTVFFGELVRGERSFAVNKCSPTFADGGQKFAAGGYCSR